MTDKDPDYIPKLEKAIAQKYGTAAVSNPRQGWDDEKEREYIKQSKRFRSKIKKAELHTEKVEVDGFLINKKLLNMDTNRNCPVCSEYSFDVRDAVYLNKYQACRTCYIRWIEDREKRWATGWRPNKEE